MTKTLNTKQGSEWTNDEGQTFPAQTLYRFEDENGEGGCWYASLEAAGKSWERWVEGSPRRAKRAADNQRLLERVAANSDADDPFSRFDA